MANIIKPKRSNTAAKVPTTTDLVSGELGVNMADQKVYINNGTAVVQVGAGNIAGLGDVAITAPSNGQGLQYNSTTQKWVNVNSGGTGDVVGPASATDNAITRFDTTTGKLIQNSLVTLDDNGTLANVNGVSFNTTPATPPTATGSMYWDSGDGTPSVILNANTSLQVGQESVARVYNGTGVTITKGQVVAVAGAQGQRPSVVLADADTEALSAPTLGIATENIANGTEGFVCTFGFVRGIDTSAFTAGQPVYLSSTPGAFTATKPQAPQHMVALGWVIKINASSGEIFVNINNGWELDELHNVQINSAASGNTLIYDATAAVWKNANLTAGTGISVTNGAGSISIANSGVLSVTGTSPVASSGGQNPAISLASGYGDTQNPYASKTANFVLAAPNGTAGAPSFRAIVAADIPTLNQNTTGTASNVTGTVAIANGGTGSTTAAAALTALGAYPATNPSGYTSNTGTVTSITAGTGLSGGSITTSGTIALANTTVTAGSYTNANITVDAQGRITTASNGSSASGTVTSVGGTGTVAGISLSGTVTTSGNLTLGGTFALPNDQVTGKMIYDSFTATASQTTFTTSATYTASKIDVYVNGVKVRNGSDVTVTSGTSVVMASGLPVGTLVDLVYPI